MVCKIHQKFIYLLLLLNKICFYILKLRIDDIAKMASQNALRKPPSTPSPQKIPTDMSSRGKESWFFLLNEVK